jgi:hypothetical protein
MKLLLHIGTQKTGSTALQQALFANPGPLAESGFRYAVYGMSDKASELAHALLRPGRNPLVHDFLDAEARLASRLGAHTVVLSAEAFYGRMLYNALSEDRVLDDPIDAEHRLVDRLRAHIPDSIESVQIACYLRRPDRYAEALYCERVLANRYAGSIQQFLGLIKPALRYGAYLGCWADVFGKEHLTVRPYERVSNDLIDDFIRNVLGADGPRLPLAALGRANARLTRDIMEFALIQNRRPGPRAYAPLERNVLAAVDHDIGNRAEPRSSQDYLAPAERRHLLAELEPELRVLRETYRLPPFPAAPAEATDTDWSPYPGLSPERRREIERAFRLVARRPEFASERAAIRRSRVTQRLRRLTRFTGKTDDHR